MSLRRNIRWRQIPKVKRITFVNGRKRTILVRPSPLPRGKPDVRNVAAVVDTINNGPASSNVPTSTPGTSSTYIERRQMLFSAWENLRPQLLATRLEEMAPASSICILCKDTVAGIVRCLDCGPTAYYCPTCAHSSHEHIMFHTPQIWKGSMYIPLKMSSVFKRAEHNCASQYNSTVFAVDITGKQHKICVAFCRCEDMAVTLLRYNLWPATPTSPRVAFDLKFMELLAVLQLECHLSARSFCEAISYMCSYFIHPSSTDMVTSIYRAVVGDCLSEYHVHRSSLNSRNGVTESTIGRECPVCLQNPPLVSMDANFGLVHKASSGHEMPARNKNLFYKHQGHLKDFIDDYSADRKSQSIECSNFQAGNVLRSKKKNSKLDVTGVFGSVCKHDIPLVFLDMFHGERLVYPVFLLSSVLAGVSLEKVIVMYDISCSLKRHLQKQNNSAILEKCEFSVPVFHSFAHNMGCQLKFGQRYTSNTGLTDGEGIERLWSYLRGFKKITKEMSINNRRDLITEALLHHTGKAIGNMAFRMSEKFKKAEQVYSDNNSIVEKVLSDQVTNATVNSWSDHWKSLCENRRSKATSLTANELYAHCLDKIQVTRHAIEDTLETFQKDVLQNELERLIKEENRLKKKASVTADEALAMVDGVKEKQKQHILKMLKDLSMERQYLSSTMKKYADGQGVFIRIAKQFAKNTNQIQKQLECINALCPSELTFADVSKPASDVFTCLTTSTITISQQRAVEAHSLASRAKEEITGIKFEVENYLSYLVSQSNYIMHNIDTMFDDSRLAQGKLHYLYYQHFCLEILWNSCSVIQQYSDKSADALPMKVYELLGAAFSGEVDFADVTPEEINVILHDISEFEDADNDDDDDDDEDGDDD